MIVYHNSLITSYLRFRCQAVEIDKYISDLLPIRSGVPQGSILGPFLFIVYINDIVTIADDLKFVIYADDTSIFLSSTSIDDLISRCNVVLYQLNKWAQINKLQINHKKTKAVVFRPRGKKVNITANIKLGNECIEVVSHVKSLGVYFSYDMTWNTQVDMLLVKISRLLGIMFRCRSILPEHIKLLIYNSFFFSRLCYCHSVWGNTTRTNINKIFLIQKRFLRCIADMPAREPTDALFRKYNVLKAEHIFEYYILKKTRFCKDEQAAFLSSLAQLVEYTPTYNMRQTDPWKVPFTRTEYGKQMFSYCLPQILNKYFHQGLKFTDLTKRRLRDYFISS